MSTNLPHSPNQGGQPMFCPNCGIANPPQARSCIRCGHPLPQQVPLSQPANQYQPPPFPPSNRYETPPPSASQSQPSQPQQVQLPCPSCGYINLPQMAYCVRCGYHLASPG